MEKSAAFKSLGEKMWNTKVVAYDKEGNVEHTVSSVFGQFLPCFLIRISVTRPAKLEHVGTKYISLQDR